MHEIKWDGVRALVEVGERVVRVWSRTGRDISVAFPELAGLGAVPSAVGVVLDGELVQLADGVPRLSGLADRIHLTDARRAHRLAEARPATLLAFDVLRYDGRDVTGLSWQERRGLLEGIGLDDVSWQVPQVFEDGQTLLAAAEDQGLEGIVSKRVRAPYRPGRSHDWLKFPLRQQESFVVAGYRLQTQSDRVIGSLLLGERTEEGLRYRGRVGSGVTGRTEARLRQLLERVAECPLDGLEPRKRAELERVDTVWVRPGVVVEVAFSQRTKDGRLRQPSVKGIRQDVDTD